MDIPNITNSLDTLYIHYDLVDYSIVDGEYGVQNKYGRSKMKLSI